jgi:protein involved in polysaccharide export with SLBB domain
VFDLGAGRERVLKGLMNEIRLQANLAQPAQVVNVSGRVKAPGDYPLEIGMRVSDLIRAGGSLEDAAYGGKAELSRYVVEQGQNRRTQVIDIDLAAVLSGDPAANIELQPFDGLYIKEISGWSEQEQVVLRGEVRFPGTYPIKRGESLSSVIGRAGGLTDLAFAQGSVFTREELKKREQEQLDRLAERMRSDLVSVSLMAARANQAGASQTYSIGQSLLEQLRAAKAVGRLVIDLPTALTAAPGSSDDVILRNGDELVVPKRRQEVTVMGEVQNVSSHLFQDGRSRDEYIALSGTPPGRPQEDLCGQGRRKRGGGLAVWLWLGRIRTGDSVVVPLDTERLPQLAKWSAVTQIIYNLAIAVAAVNSF